MIHPHRALVVQFAMPSARNALRALFAIEQEVLHSVASDLDHSVAHARLDYWDAELRALVTARATHPLARMLTEETLALELTPPDLGALVDAARVLLASSDDDTLREHVHAAWSRSIFTAAALLEAAATARELHLDLPMTIATARRVASVAGAKVHAIEWHSTTTNAPLALREQLRAALRDFGAAELPHCAGTIAWCALAERQACGGSSGRFEPLRRTIAAWRATVACRRGQFPRALTEPA